MRVAIFYTPDNPHSGGSFTYSQIIYRGLLELAAKSKHTFVVFTEHVPLAGEFVGSSNIEHVLLPTGLSVRLEKGRLFLTHIVRKVMETFKNPLQASSGRSLYESFQQDYMLKLMKRHQIDIFWSFIPFGPLVYDMPYILTIWDLQHRLQPFFPEVSIQNEWELREKHYSAVIRKATFIIVGTEIGKQEIERFYALPAERIRVLPQPTVHSENTDKNQSLDSTLSELGLQPGFLFYPAQFWPHKNHVGLLKAVVYLKEKHGLELDVVFTGAEQGNLKYIQRCITDFGLTDQVHMLGFVSNDALVALYKNAFALTFVSYFGPDNLPPLEAFSLDCPVIAAKVSGVEEQLGDAALLFEPNNPEELAEIIFQLYNDPNLRETLIQRGKDRTHYFSDHDYIQRVFTMLDEFEPTRKCWDVGPFCKQ